MSVTLAIETSQRIGSVALRADSGTIHVEYLRASRAGRHGDDLMPAIDRLFRRVELKPGALRTVAVSIGPGSFTGLRIAVSTARMLAETLGAALIAVPSALVAAENFDPTMLGSTPAADVRIVSALASKRETFWATRMLRIDGAWSIEGEPGLADADSFDLACVSAIVADEHLPAKARHRVQAAGVAIVAPILDAAACLRVGQRLAAAGAFCDPLALMPLYPRQPEAVSLWETKTQGQQTS